MITFVFFFVLIGLAFLADRLNQKYKRKRKKKQLDDTSKLADSNHPLGTPRSLDSSRSPAVSVLEVGRLNKLLD